MEDRKFLASWASFALAAVPGALKERVIGITRELIEAHHSGMAWNTDALNEVVNSVPRARSLMHLVEQEFNYRLPMFA